MLQISKLSFAYNNQKTLHFQDFTCQTGEHWLLLGQSGSGKTTLLHLLGGLLTPQNGQIIVDNTDTTTLNSTQLDRFRGKHIGIIFQQSHFINALNIEENLKLAQQLAGLNFNQSKADELLERLNIAHKKHSKPKELSIGEQQRAAVARALINQPSIILADEPTSALDDNNCEEVVRLLTTRAKDLNATLLIVTHDGRLKERFEQKILL